MRRVIGLVVLLAALLLSGRAEAQSCDGCGISFRPASVSSAGGTMTGPLVLPDGTASVPSWAWSSDADGSGTGMYRPSANAISWSINGVSRGSFSGNNINLLQDASAIAFGVGLDAFLVRDAANTLALRNSTAAQQFNLYETYTDASNRSYLAIQATAGAFKLLPQAAGTGTLRVVAIGDGGTKPACDSSSRGGIWYDAGGAGAADTFEVCRKDAADAYAWVSIF